MPSTAMQKLRAAMANGTVPNASDHADARGAYGLEPDDSDPFGGYGAPGYQGNVQNMPLSEAAKTPEGYLMLMKNQGGLLNWPGPEQPNISGGDYANGGNYTSPYATMPLPKGVRPYDWEGATQQRWYDQQAALGVDPPGYTGTTFTDARGMWTPPGEPAMQPSTGGEAYASGPSVDVGGGTTVYKGMDGRLWASSPNDPPAWAGYGQPYVGRASRGGGGSGGFFGPQGPETMADEQEQSNGETPHLAVYPGGQSYISTPYDPRAWAGYGQPLSGVNMSGGSGGDYGD